MMAELRRKSKVWVDQARKREVPSDFNQVADSYDFLTGLDTTYAPNLVLSARRMELGASPRILDLCCGTGVSTEALRSVYPDARIVGLDASDGMIGVARAKQSLRDVEFVVGDAMDPESAGIQGPFDAIFMAYGIRNVPEPDLCLRRLHALLKPSGVLGLHEYSVADSVRARALWELVCWSVIIPAGWFWARNTRIYRYLRSSVHGFDGVRTLEARIARAGFQRVRSATMPGWQRGILHTFVARAPRADAVERVWN